MKVSPKLWYGFWLVWSLWTLALHAENAARRVLELPHNHVAGPLVATFDIAMIVLCAVLVRASARCFAAR